MGFEIIGNIQNAVVIATSYSIRNIKRIRKVYGKGRWRKMKGIANVRLSNGTVSIAEFHWYEAHGIWEKGNKN